MSIQAMNTLEIEVIEGREDELSRSLQAFIAHCQRLPGCLAYGLVRSSRHPRLWLISGYWENPEALASHCAAGELDALIWEIGRQALSIRFMRYVAQTSEEA